MLSVGIAPPGIGNGVQAGGTAQQQTLADLPVAAQQTISSAVGQDESAYHAASAAAGVTLANPANDFTAQFQSEALQVSAGSDTWNMSLVGLGDGYFGTSVSISGNTVVVVPRRLTVADLAACRVRTSERGSLDDCRRAVGIAAIEPRWPTAPARRESGRLVINSLKLEPSRKGRVDLFQGSGLAVTSLNKLLG